MKKLFKLFVKILLINVVVLEVIFVGCVIIGKNIFEYIIFKNFLVDL